MTPWWVRLSSAARWRRLRRGQRITGIELTNAGVLQRAVSEGQGVLIAPNHSAHYDSAALYSAADQLKIPLYFMTAWQVFAMSGRFERWAMQRMGCFSVDRESNDRQAYKQAITILQQEPYPLVIFPEGDIYHTSDHVTPFREGAAAVALAAARRAERPLVIIPCGIKFWYVDDPSDSLRRITEILEQRLYLRPLPDETLQVRIHRLAEAALALKELDYLGMTRSGRVRDRVLFLTEAVLEQLESRHTVKPQASSPPERVKALRQSVIRQLEECRNEPESNQRGQRLHADMEDLFFVMQLYSYRGDYLVDGPSVERLAETLDKFEEDILQRDLPSVRGRRRVTVEFGEPIAVDAQDRGRRQVADLTAAMQTAVQGLIDGLNRRHERKPAG